MNQTKFIESIKSFIYLHKGDSTYELYKKFYSEIEKTKVDFPDVSVKIRFSEFGSFDVVVKSSDYFMSYNISYPEYYLIFKNLVTE